MQTELVQPKHSISKRRIVHKYHLDAPPRYGDFIVAVCGHSTFFGFYATSSDQRCVVCVEMS